MSEPTPPAAVNQVPFPSRGRVIGVDFGSVRIGLAVCDADRIISSPHQTYERRGPDADTAYFRKLAAAEGAVGFVVGLAILLNGDEGPKAKECRAFGAWLGQVTSLPVAFWDERFTTAAAEDSLLSAGLTNKKRKGRRDRVAAQLILQAFLDAGCPSGT
ncbi:Holliday junction resolvase RuvX [Fimbriiglobus ruber]|uniref:Putative pre-16S rRNA nuclease n=1 Tax=Fimbriiglobus ruber TaxID=1908690 RepID=A0A225EAB4_9BACT|nr:Holliday junction resolvase RuvX [Fimbriiglobus ruber]OWK46976.1 putative Holliday junction resolvase YggF [Fimbriiglobus ruber]